MKDFLRFYGKLLAACIASGAVLLLDELFAGPLAFVTGVPLATLKQYETTIFLLAVTLLVARVVRRDVVHGMLERRSGAAIPKLIGDLSSVVVFFTGICFITAVVYKKDITALLATGGASLMVVGIAARDLLMAAFTGVILNIEKPFRTGDQVKINDKYIGKVEVINWRSTILQTWDNERLIIPNLILANAVILNYAQPDTRQRRHLEVLIDYDTSVESAERILYAAVLGAEIKLTRPPVVTARRLERDGVIYELLYTIVDYDEDRKSDHAVIKSVLNCMRDAGITISFPKREIIHSERRAHIADRSLDIFHLVQQVRLFRRFNEDVCRRIANALQHHHFAKGATIVQAGEQRNAMFIVGEGMTRRTQTNRDGSSLVEQRFIATEAFGRKALFALQAQAATVIAETDVLIFELDNRSLAKLLSDIPNFLEDLANALALLNWQEMRIGPPDGEPDPVAIAHLVNLYRGQMEACYGKSRLASPSV